MDTRLCVEALSFLDGNSLENPWYFPHWDMREGGGVLGREGSPPFDRS